jgi:hypothetical protein
VSLYRLQGCRWISEDPARVSQGIRRKESETSYSLPSSSALCPRTLWFGSCPQEQLQFLLLRSVGPLVLTSASRGALRDFRTTIQYDTK